MNIAIEEVRKYLSLFRGFMVSLQRARKTRNASLMKRSFRVSCFDLPCSCSGRASSGLGVSNVCLKENT